MNPVPQPAKGILALRRISNTEVAERLGLSTHFVGRVLNGYQPPSARVRSGLAVILGLPEEALFRSRDDQPVAS